jgi:2-dehydro-3-deoxyphosphogluconate aldolase/(4S)-4-hydroxy-2-oxoglutarate aldolase
MTRVMDILDTHIVRHLGEAQIIALATFEDAEQAEVAGAALMQGGVSCVELTSPDARLIQAARRVEGLLVGAGGIHSAQDAEAAVRGGAHFATAPATNMEVVHACRELELPLFPGVATPSEIERLTLVGVRTMRLFPAAPLGGPAFLQAVSVHFPDVGFIPSGGIELEGLRSYLSLASVVAVCGEGLVRDDLLRSRSFNRIEWLAREATRAARPTRR